MVIWTEIPFKYMNVIIEAVIKTLFKMEKKKYHFQK